MRCLVRFNPVSSSLLLAVIAVGSQLCSPTAALAGEQLDLTWADCVVAPADADRDGLDDACEFAVAAAFEPEMVFGLEETATERIPFWAARPDGEFTMRIFYALAYRIDAGDPTFGGVSAHEGDSEFIVLRVHYDGNGLWSLVEGYLSAHYGTGCDAGDWFTNSEFQYVNSVFGRPLVFSAEGKHANYTDLDRCDSGGCFQDHCSDETREPVGIEPDRDLGLQSTQLIDEHVVDGNSEWFWTDVIFCGWQLSPGADRSECVPVDNSYSRQLTSFEMDYGPVTGEAALCEPCQEDSDCMDGGLCLDGLCGQACEAGSCPEHAYCEGEGVGQCLPIAADCACFLACQERACGDDGCGNSCGTCPSGESCDVTGQCQPAGTCVPDCSGRTCGDDDCNGSCGSCNDGETCDASGQCSDSGSGGSGGGNSDSEESGAGCECQVDRSKTGKNGSLLACALLGLAKARRRRRYVTA
jgi:hypothetical protein